MTFRDRLLYNPGEPAGGAAPAAPAAAQPQQQPAHPDFGKPPASSAEPPRPAQVYLSPEQWESTQGELKSLREFQATVKQEMEAKEAQRVEALARAGKIEEAFEATRTQYEAKVAAESGKARELETRWLGEKTNNALNEALAGVTFGGDDPRATAAMVRQILAPEIEAALDQAGNPVVRHRVTLRPAVDHIRERLASPEFKIFIAASNRGGSGSDGARPAATHANPSPGDPNAEFAKQFLERQAALKNARY